MAVYFITGKLGAGKTLAGVKKIQMYLQQGRRVATNLDINLEYLMPANSKATITRLPDKPRAQDLYDIGTGDNNHWTDNATYNEQRFGALVLDECATWLNTRNFRDKERAAFIEYLLHARKYRWDIYFFVQDEKAIDKQILEALCEHLVVVKRLDRVSIPMFSFWIKVFSLGLVKIKLPKIHLALVFYGVARGSIVVDRWFMYGSSLYNAYRTGQVFSDDRMFLNDDFVDMRAPYTILSAWHIKGRYLPNTWQRFLHAINRVIWWIFARGKGDAPPAFAGQRQPFRITQKSSLVMTVSSGEPPLRF